MVRSTKYFNVVWVLLILSTAAAAGPETTELVSWSVAERPPGSGPSAAAVVNEDQFLAKHPWIRMKKGGGPQLQRFGRGTRELLMAMAGGIAPDVIEMSDVDLQDFTSRNFLLPLNDFASGQGVLQQILAHPLAGHFARDGKIYALPGTVWEPKPYTYVLVYRKDIFRRVGLDPEMPPTTWKQFLEYADRLTDPAENRVGFVIPTLETKGSRQTLGAGAFMELILALNGVEAIRRDQQGRWIADFADDPRALEALTFLKELLGRRITRGGKTVRGLAGTSAGVVDDAIMLDQSPRAAMVIKTMDELGWHISRGTSIRDLGVALLPLGPSGDGFVPLTARYLGVNATSPQARQRAAWQWIWFNQRSDLHRIRAKAFVEWGWSAFIDPADTRLDPQLAAFVDDVPRQWAEVYRRQMDKARAVPMCPQHRILRQEYLKRPVDELLNNPDLNVEQLLKTTEATINKEVFSSLPPRVQQRRRTIALAVVAVATLAIIMGIFLMVRGLAKTVSTSHSQGSLLQARRRRTYLLAGLMMIPAVGSMILWMYLPLVRGAMIAFQDYQLIGETRWVGLDNFIAVLTDPKFWISFWRTVQYGLLSLSLGFIIPIVLAFFLVEVPRFKITFRVLFYLPALTSGLVIMFLWKWMYDPTELGLFNTLIAQFGQIFGLTLGPYGWLDSPNLAMISVILPAIWAGMGPGCIIYLAALHGVPESLYEAADLDGAGVWTKIWHVAIPFIKPLIIINFIGAFIATFHIMQNIFVMTGGGPGDATHVIGLYIFFNSFIWLNFGKATAAAWILGSLLIGFTIYQLRILRELKFRAAGQEAN